ncbi:DUF1080 domain-containing protein [candidate division KSB1 bacterium]|nr:DUF1080 domain-containing protein [candidate division KSB1 bacterium]
MKTKWIVTILLSVLLTIPSCSILSGGWISLFDGESLTGWKTSEHPESAWVEDGVIVCNGERAHVFYMDETGDADFKNFEVAVDVKTEPGSNSGFYFHTKYQKEGWPSSGFEVQVNNSQKQHGDYLEMKKTTSLYGVRNLYKAFVKDNEWFTLHLLVIDNRIRIKLNDMLVVDFTVPEDDPHYNAHGTFALQGHDPESTVYFRNIRVKSLPDDATDPAEDLPIRDELYADILQLGKDNFPLVDYHIHLKGRLTIEQALANSRKVGIQYGIAPNCGVGFPIQDDAGIDAFLKSMKGVPVLLGMQAEGREWVNMFSKEAISKFDYVFSDGMTFTDRQGRRTRLWIPEEVHVDDEQDFMEQIVETIVGVISNEPIDIYVNPTYLPEVMADEYDELWTESRMKRVINAAVEHNVAIEINSRYKLPSEKFIRMAKDAGVKFAMGTNNSGADLGRLEYSIEMVKKCGLTWQDMFIPKSVRP